MTLQERQELAENYLGLVDWQESGTEGYCRCPGQAKHTTPNGPKDCIVYVTGAPTVHCFHRSCQDDTDEYSAPLRKVLPIDKDPGEKPFNKSEWKKRAARNAEIKGLAAATSERLLRSERSQRLPSALSSQKSWEFFLDLFKLQDILWIGERNHSGWYGRGHFKTMEEWAFSRWDDWPFTCAGTFKSNHHYHRSKLHILTQPYTVIEFDHLDPDPETNKGLGLNFFLDLVETYHLVLRMAVDTGGKSLHFWVDNDPTIFDEEFVIFLRALGADIRLLQLAQPVRCPGIIRPETGKQQAVLVL